MANWYIKSATVSTNLLVLEKLTTDTILSDLHFICIAARYIFIKNMWHPIVKISILLLLIVTTHSYPDEQNSEKAQTDVERTEDEESVSPNPDESGDYLQGDIKISPSSGIRNGLRDTNARWPKGVIPYKISPSFNAQQQQLIREAMNDYHRFTCIKFRPYMASDKDYIYIKSDEKGCWSRVGRLGVGKQDVNLNIPGCIRSKGTVIHELMHTIGFYHEQSRSDRDNYVIIKWDNIDDPKKHQHNFDKYNPSEITAFGAGYDFGSIMHYSATAFSKSSNLPTIVPRGNKKVTFGQRKGLSSIDIAKIKRMYNCVNQNGK